MMAGMQIRIALGEGEITAVLPDREVTIPLDPILRPRIEDPGPALRQGFGRLETELRREYGEDRLSGGVRLQVALLPPLSETRLIELPPLRSTEVEAVLRRIAPRHFLVGGRDAIVGGERFGKGVAADSAPVLAAAADRNLVEAIHQAAESREWQLERIVPAQAAWMHALLEAAPLTVTDRSGNGSEVTRLVVAVVGELIYLVRLVGGQPDLIRRTAAGDLPAIVAAAGPEPGRALLLAAGEMRDNLARALVEAGWVLISPEEPRTAAVEAACQTAAALPELVSPPQARARSLREKRRTRIMLGMAALLLVAAAPVHLWGVNRALDDVRGERAALRQLFSPALAQRDSLDRLVERIESLQAVEQVATRWTACLVELSELLPRDTHLVSLRGEGERVVLEAMGERAGETLSALRRAESFRDVRIEGLIQRELEGGETSRERFTLSLVLTVGGDR